MARLYELLLVALLNVDGPVLLNVLDYEGKPHEINLPFLQGGTPNTIIVLPLQK